MLSEEERALLTADDGFVWPRDWSIHDTVRGMERDGRVSVSIRAPGSFDYVTTEAGERALRVDAIIRGLEGR